MRSLRASPVFALAVLITLGLAGFNGLMVALMASGLAFLLPGPFAQMTHFTEEHHRIHDLTFGFLFLPAIVGMLAQLRRPSENVAGQLMALIPWVGLLLTAVLTVVLTSNAGVLGPQWIGVAAFTYLATTLHPAGRELFRSFSVSRVNLVMLALVIIAAVPLLALAASSIGEQGTARDEHALAGHYGFMAAFAFTVIGVGLLASLRPDGWRLTAWVAGLLPALLGLASLVYPDASSSLSLAWALATIAWGVGFVTAAELTKGVISKDDAGVRLTEDRPPGAPRWVRASGIIVIGLVSLLFIIGGGVGGGPPSPGLHGP